MMMIQGGGVIGTFQGLDCDYPNYWPALLTDHTWSGTVQSCTFYTNSQCIKKSSRIELKLLLSISRFLPSWIDIVQSCHIARRAYRAVKFIVKLYRTMQRS